MLLGSVEVAAPLAEGGKSGNSAHNISPFSSQKGSPGNRAAGLGASTGLAFIGICRETPSYDGRDGGGGFPFKYLRNI